MMRPGKLVFAVILTFPLAFAFGQEEGGSLNQEIEQSPDGIAPEIEERNALDASYELPVLMGNTSQTLRKWRERVAEKTGVEWTLSYDTVAQQYVSGDRSFGGLAGDLTLSGQWHLFGEKINAPASLAFRLRHRHDLFGADAPSEIRESADLLWGPIDGFSDSGFQVPDLYMDQRFLDDRLLLRYGQMTIDSLFDGHSLSSAKRSFLSQAFATNPAAAFPTFGAGFVGRWRVERWDLTAGFSNVQGTREDEVSWNLDSDSLFEALQIGFNFEGWDDEPARLQIAAWHSDEFPQDDLPEGEGISLTFEQRNILENSRFIARYAYASGEATRSDHFMALALAQDIRKFDNWGVGLGLGRSSRNSDHWQGVVEGFYRWQATRELRITPDVQFILSDGGDAENFQVVFGLRAGATF